MHVLFVIIFIIFLAAGFVYFIEGPKCGQYNVEREECSYNETLPCKYHPECTENQTTYTNVFISSYWAAVSTRACDNGTLNLNQDNVRIVIISCDHTRF